MDYYSKYLKYKKKYLDLKQHGGNVLENLKCETKDLEKLKGADLKYYQHTYKPPSKLDETIKKLGINPSIVDKNINKNCCNCISISLYDNGTLKDNKNDRMKIFLNCILKSVMNVRKILPREYGGWIVRIYINNIALQTIEENENYKKCYDKIIGYDNTEIYKYNCPIDNLNITRTFRYHPIYDKTVNFYAIREADGIVSNLDCYNLFNFFNLEQHKNKLFYLPDLFDQKRYKKGKHGTKYTVPFYSYSDWLIYYKTHIKKEFYIQNNNIIDLIAGGFCSKIKLKEDFYNDTFLNLKANFDTILEDLKYCLEMETNLYDCKPIYNNNITYIFDRLFKSQKVDVDTKSQSMVAIQKLDKEIDKELISSVRVGFDEMLLLELFSPFISCNFILFKGFFILNNDNFDYIQSLMVDIQENIREDILTTPKIEITQPTKDPATSSQISSTMEEINNKRSEEQKSKLFDFDNKYHNEDGIIKNFKFINFDETYKTILHLLNIDYIFQ